MHSPPSDTVDHLNNVTLSTFMKKNEMTQNSFGDENLTSEMQCDRQRYAKFNWCQVQAIKHGHQQFINKTFHIRLTFRFFTSY